jgi:hypothetical protein
MSGVVIMTGVHPNPPGRDVQAFNGEFVLVQNLSQLTADVGGWFIRDSKNVPLVVPIGTTVGPGGHLRVYSGTGQNFAGHIYCNRRRAVLNQAGDTLTLFDRSGHEVQRFSYGRGEQNRKKRPTKGGPASGGRGRGTRPPTRVQPARRVRL